MIARLRSESGQAILVSAVFMTVLLGAVAMTLDVGSWYREHRQAQATADAAALAGAQALPGDPAQAISLAKSYADQNGGGLEPSMITVSSDWDANDTIKVEVHRVAPGFFSKLFGIDSVTVKARAGARSVAPGEARYVAPIVVSQKHPLLSCKSCPKFGETTTLPLDSTGAPGAFALLNLDPNDQTGTIGAKTLGEWIDKGFDEALPLGRYYSDPGAKWNDAPIQDALTERMNTELLFPVYDILNGQGSNAKYRIIGWVGFHITGATASGSSGSLTGWFTRYIADGIQAVKAPPNGSTKDFGVRSVALIQ